MGCWGHDIMESDAAYDSAATIFELLGVADDEIEGTPHPLPLLWSEGERNSIIAALQEPTQAIKDYINNSKSAHDYEVLGVIYMGAGVAMTDQCKQAIIDVCRDDIVLNADMPDRCNHVAEFIEKLTAFEGAEPVATGGVGLFDKMATAAII